MFAIIIWAILAVVIIGVCSFVSFRQDSKFRHFTHWEDGNWNWDQNCWFPEVSKLDIFRYHAWRIMTDAGQRPFFQEFKLGRNARLETYGTTGTVQCYVDGSVFVWRIPLIGLLVCVERLGTSKMPCGFGVYKLPKHLGVSDVDFEFPHYRYYIGRKPECYNA